MSNISFDSETLMEQEKKKLLQNAKKIEMHPMKPKSLSVGFCGSFSILQFLQECL